MSNPFSVRDPRTSIQKLKDVKLTNISNGEILAYDSTSQLWENSDSIITISNSNITSSSLDAGSNITTGNFNVLLGQNAGLSLTSGIQNVMIGSNSGQNVNPNNTICLGYQAGFNASDDAICIGAQSGFQNCGINAVCIGPSSGFSRCGDYSVNIGTLASGNLTNGTTHDRSININATGSNSNSVANDSCVIKPIRNQTGNTMIQYDAATGEVSHSDTIEGDINILQGTLTITNTTTRISEIILDESTIGDDALIMRYNGTGIGTANRFQIGSRVSGWIPLGSGLNYIASNGRTGLGTNFPSEKLQVIGNIIITGSYLTTSDDRVKHNQVSIDNGLNIIRKLNPQFYQKTPTMKDPDYNGPLEESWFYEAGLIAQDVEQIPELSHLVVKPQLEDSEEEQPCSLRYQDLFVYNIAATKELDNKIAALESRILALEA